jgi:hypothetical protein
MLKKHMILLLAVGIGFLILPGMVAAQNLELGLRGFGGIAAGTTDNSDKTGSIGPAAGGGLVVNFYLFDLDFVRIGLSSGLEYTYLAYIYKQPVYADFTPFGIVDTDFTADARYNYLTIPASIKASFELTESVDLTVDLGAYFGFFLGGTSDNEWDPEVDLAASPPFFPGMKLEDSEADLDDSNTPSMDIGLRIAVGVDIEIMENLLLSPGVLFDYGFSDITKDVELIPDAIDTFWKVVAYAGASYRLF